MSSPSPDPETDNEESRDQGHGQEEDGEHMQVPCTQEQSEGEDMGELQQELAVVPNVHYSANETSEVIMRKRLLLADVSEDTSAALDRDPLLSPEMAVSPGRRESRSASPLVVDKDEVLGDTNTAYVVQSPMGQSTERTPRAAEATTQNGLEQDRLVPEAVDGTYQETPTGTQYAGGIMGEPAYHQPMGGNPGLERDALDSETKEVDADGRNGEDASIDMRNAPEGMSGVKTATGENTIAATTPELTHVNTAATETTLMVTANDSADISDRSVTPEEEGSNLSGFVTADRSEEHTPVVTPEVAQQKFNLQQMQSEGLSYPSTEDEASKSSDFEDQAEENLCANPDKQLKGVEFTPSGGNSDDSLKNAQEADKSGEIDVRTPIPSVQQNIITPYSEAALQPLPPAFFPTAKSDGEHVINNSRHKWSLLEEGELPHAMEIAGILPDVEMRVDEQSRNDITGAFAEKTMLPVDDGELGLPEGKNLGSNDGEHVINNARHKWNLLEEGELAQDMDMAGILPDVEMRVDEQSRNDITGAVAEKTMLPVDDNELGLPGGKNLDPNNVSRNSVVTPGQLMKGITPDMNEAPETPQIQTEDIEGSEQMSRDETAEANAAPVSSDERMDAAETNNYLLSGAFQDVEGDPGTAASDVNDRAYQDNENLMGTQYRAGGIIGEPSYHEAMGGNQRRNTDDLDPHNEDMDEILDEEDARIKNRSASGGTGAVNIATGEDVGREEMLKSVTPMLLDNIGSIEQSRPSWQLEAYETEGSPRQHQTPRIVKTFDEPFNLSDDENAEQMKSEEAPKDGELFNRQFHEMSEQMHSDDDMPKDRNLQCGAPVLDSDHDITKEILSSIISGEDLCTEEDNPAEEQILFDAEAKEESVAPSDPGQSAADEFLEKNPSLIEVGLVEQYAQKRVIAKPMEDCCPRVLDEGQAPDAQCEPVHLYGSDNGRRRSKNKYSYASSRLYPDEMVAQTNYSHFQRFEVPEETGNTDDPKINPASQVNIPPTLERKESLQKIEAEVVLAEKEGEMGPILRGQCDMSEHSSDASLLAANRSEAHHPVQLTCPIRALEDLYEEEEDEMNTSVVQKLEDARNNTWSLFPREHERRMPRSKSSSRRGGGGGGGGGGGQPPQPPKDSDDGGKKKFDPRSSPHDRGGPPDNNNDDNDVDFDSASSAGNSGGRSPVGHKNKEYSNLEISQWCERTPSYVADDSRSGESVHVLKSVSEVSSSSLSKSAASRNQSTARNQIPSESTRNASWLATPNVRIETFQPVVSRADTSHNSESSKKSNMLFSISNVSSISKISSRFSSHVEDMDSVDLSEKKTENSATDDFVISDMLSKLHTAMVNLESSSSEEVLDDPQEETKLEPKEHKANQLYFANSPEPNETLGFLQVSQLNDSMGSSGLTKDVVDSKRKSTMTHPESLQHDSRVTNTTQTPRSKRSVCGDTDNTWDHIGNAEKNEKENTFELVEHPGQFHSTNHVLSGESSEFSEHEATSCDKDYVRTDDKEHAGEITGLNEENDASFLKFGTQDTENLVEDTAPQVDDAVPHRGSSSHWDRGEELARAQSTDMTIHMHDEASLDAAGNKKKKKGIFAKLHWKRDSKSLGTGLKLPRFSRGMKRNNADGGDDRTISSKSADSRIDSSSSRGVRSLDNEVVAQAGFGYVTRKDISMMSKIA